MGGKCNFIFNACVHTLLLNCHQACIIKLIFFFCFLSLSSLFSLFLSLSPLKFLLAPPPSTPILVLTLCNNALLVPTEHPNHSVSHAHYRPTQLHLTSNISPYPQHRGHAVMHTGHSYLWTQMGNGQGMCAACFRVLMSTNID